MERLSIVLVAVAALACLSSVESSDMNIGQMITWVDPTVNWMIGALKFKNYGCYCNKDGETNTWTPVDAIDSCCQVHNTCYNDLVTRGTCPADTFGQSYDFSKIKENGRKIIKCKNEHATCKYELCKCDAAVAECFGTNEHHYTSSHKSFKKQCQRATEL